MPAAVLDACVLAAHSLCDTLLRLAEPPELFEPKWPDEILDETVRTLEGKLGWPRSLTAHLRRELRASFSDAWITGYEPLVPNLLNHPKDRHVLAAAIRGRVPIIVTFNLRDFRPEHLSIEGVVAQHPDAFLLSLLRDHSAEVAMRVQRQAVEHRRSLESLLATLGKSVPEFALALRSELGWRDSAVRS